MRNTEVKSKRKNVPKAQPIVHREGTPIFDTKVRKNLTPGEWKPEMGVATNVRWWDFLKKEKEIRTKKRISYTITYDSNRKRISVTSDL